MTIRVGLFDLPDVVNCYLSGHWDFDGAGSVT